MGLLSSIVGGGVVDVAKGIGEVVDKFVETADEKRAWEAIKLKMAQEPQLAQIEINKLEAQHRTVFVAGWRPAIGWICATALAWNFIIQPIMMWVAFLFEVDISSAPELNAGDLMTILLGMLGLGGLRSYDKSVGTSK